MRECKNNTENILEKRSIKSPAYGVIVSMQTQISYT